MVVWKCQSLIWGLVMGLSQCSSWSFLDTGGLSFISGLACHSDLGGTAVLASSSCCGSGHIDPSVIIVTVVQCHHAPHCSGPGPV